MAVDEAEKPTLADIRATIARMEAKLEGSTKGEARELMSLYERLIVRFAADLPSEREQLLSRAAVLMLIQAVDQDGSQQG